VPEQLKNAGGANNPVDHPATHGSQVRLREKHVGEKKKGDFNSDKKEKNQVAMQ